MRQGQPGLQPRVEFGRVASPLEQCAVFLALLGLIYVAFPVAMDARLGRGVLISLSVIGLWRWSWGGLHYLRAIIYRYWYYPTLRRRAEQAMRDLGPIREVTVVATTYNEVPWITKQVVRSLIAEFHSLSDLDRPPTLVFVTGGDLDDETVCHEFECAVAEFGESECWPPELVLLRGDQGKRLAIAKALHYLAERGVSRDGVIALMDGDSALEPGMFTRCLPIFRLSENVGGVTTNERPLIEAPSWFAEWINLRFGQRHLYMSSISLSHRVLCLTGRFSLYRGDIATNASFINQVENDYGHHWLFGEYRMFSGDDKSTWFWLASHRYEMLYVPDATAVTYELIDENPYRRAIANLVRWSGNTLRNSWRVISRAPAG